MHTFGLRISTLAFAACLLLPAPQDSDAAGRQFVTIGTGGVTGVYFPVGGAICRLANRIRKKTGVRCSVESTGGSIANINSIRDGDIELGMAQSDWQHHAYEGTSAFSEKGKFSDLRAVFSLHPEPVTIVAHNDSGISGITDLKGKRVNIGNPGSGTRGTWEVVEKALGWSRSDLKYAAELKSAATGQAVCDKAIDAFFGLVGHPSALTQEALTSCPSHLVDVSGPAIDSLVAKNGFYRKATIPAGMYNNKKAIRTFGVSATLVTSAKVSADAVYAIVKSVFDDFKRFKRLHPSLAGLKAKEMATKWHSAPLHEGAKRYYKEQGWL